MQGYNTTTTPNVTGIIAITPGFTPKYVRITVSSRLSSDNFAHLSEGAADSSGWTTNHTFMHDTTGGSTRRTAGNMGKIVSALERVSGVITEVNAASFDSFTATQVRINVTNVTQLYQYNIEIYG